MIPEARQNLTLVACWKMPIMHSYVLNVIALWLTVSNKKISKDYLIL